MAYPFVIELQASAPLDEPSLHGRDPWLDGVKVSDSELIASLVGRDGVLPSVIKPLELGTYEWRTRMIFPNLSHFFGPARWRHGHYYRSGSVASYRESLVSDLFRKLAFLKVRDLILPSLDLYL